MISQEMPKISILDTSLKITDLRLQPHLPGANELAKLNIDFNRGNSLDGHYDSTHTEMAVVIHPEMVINSLAPIGDFNDILDEQFSC